jgi:hypothetical protein
VTNLQWKETANQIDYEVGIFNPDVLQVTLSLKLAVAVAIGSLKIFQLVYPERFALTSLDTEIAALVTEMNSRFGSVFIRPARSSDA